MRSIYEFSKFIIIKGLIYKYESQIGKFDSHNNELGGDSIDIGK